MRDKRCYLEFCQFLGDGVAPEGLVLGLLFEGGHVGGFSVCVECVNGSNGGCNLGALRGLSCGGVACVRVANLRGELGTVHFLVDDLRVFANFAPKSSKGGFERDFRHDDSAMGAI